MKRLSVLLLLTVVAVFTLLSITGCTFFGPVYGSPVWSPDGSQIAFFSGQIAFPSGVQVCSIDLNSGKFKKLTKSIDVSGGMYLAWSRDGKKISFLFNNRLNNEGSGTVYLMNSDGTNLIALPATDPNSDLYWSPDGRQIAYSSAYMIKTTSGNATFSEGHLSISVIGSDGATQKRLTNVGLDRNSKYDDWNDSYSPTWSPDGKKIFYNSKKGIFSMSSDGSNQTILTSQHASYVFGGPSLSPDGTKLAFVSRDGTGQTDIYTMSVDGNNQTRITHPPDAQDPNFNWSPQSPLWSPDGTKIMFIYQRVEHVERVISWLYTVNVDGTNQKMISSEPDGFGYDPTWSPDGSRIAYCSRRGGIWVMNADGSNNRKIH